MKTNYEALLNLILKEKLKKKSIKERTEEKYQLD
jgi:hypothetical protein